MEHNFIIANKIYDLCEKPQGGQISKHRHAMLPEGTGLRKQHSTKDRIGKHCFISRDPILLQQLKEDFQINAKNEDLCIKVFYCHWPIPENTTIEESCCWGSPIKKQINGYWVKRGNVLTEVSYIQNICAEYGLAPKVYALFFGNYGGVKKPCQLCDYISQPHASGWPEVKLIREKVEKIGKLHKFTCDQEMIGEFDIKGGKILDWQVFYFTDDDNKLWGVPLKCV